MAAYIARTSELAAGMPAGDLMIMSARDSTLMSLNEVAAAIWNAADGATPLGQIVERVVCGEFDVSLEEAMKDAELLVREMAAHGILVVSDRPIEV